MADHNYYPAGSSGDPGLVKLFAKITFGASGAPTLTRGKFITSISRTSEGIFVLTLNGKFQRTLGLAGTWVATSGVPAAPNAPFISSDAVSSTGAITLRTTEPNGDGDATLKDPASGEVLLLEITLSNSGAI